jgi:hypothetical protein
VNAGHTIGGITPGYTPDGKMGGTIGPIEPPVDHEAEALRIWCEQYDGDREMVEGLIKHTPIITLGMRPGRGYFTHGGGIEIIVPSPDSPDPEDKNE